MSLDLDAVQAIRDKYPHVSPEWLPSPTRHAQWEPWVLWSDGCDDDGNFLGHCPLHDKARKRPGSAEFNFFKGIMRCQGDPRCHPKRAVSLSNVILWVVADAAK